MDTGEDSSKYNWSDITNLNLLLPRYNTKLLFILSFDWILILVIHLLLILYFGWSSRKLSLSLEDTKIQKLEAMIENMDIAKKAYLVNLYHKAGHKHEPYLETENKRPGPALDETKPEKEEMQDRKNFAAMERKKKRFLLTSNKLNLELIDWNKLVAVHNLKNEVNKIFFVSQPTGAFVIKMCSEVVPTYFASRLLQCLQVPTPDVKILSFYEQEFKAMVHSMEGLTLHDDHLRYIVRLSMDRPFILLQEYIPAITLDKIGEKRAERWLSTNYADASSRLINLGRIISADLLMNNMDRFPLIWDNDGNYTNTIKPFV